MQKCPKCGTILDDSKKQCYMCGTMLKDDSSGSFAEALGLINTPQDEIERLEDIPTPAKNEFSDNNVNVLSDELNRLNSIEITNLEKKEPVIKVDKTPEEEPKKEVKKQEKESTIKKKKEAPIQNKLPKNGTFFSQDAIESHGQMPTTTSKGNKNKKSDKHKFQIKFYQIFNFVCTIAFAVVVIIAAKHFFQDKEIPNNLGGLIYKIDKKFELLSSDGSNRFYKYNNNCSIRLMYGPTSGGEDFIDSYMENQKAEFEQQEDTKTMTEELIINGNSWKSLSIINFVQKDDKDEYDKFTKYKYVSIFHNGNFYHTVFVNADNDDTCTEMYDEFTSTLIFE